MQKKEETPFSAVIVAMFKYRHVHVLFSNHRDTLEKAGCLFFYYTSNDSPFKISHLKYS